jgi:hypothetical protein
MKKVIVAFAIVFSTVSLFAHLDSKVNDYQSSYDMPTKYEACGEWHIPGTPCPK